MLGALVLSLMAVFLSAASVPPARADTTSDFMSDVQRGLNTGAQSSVVLGIKAQDYQTSWDEFGTNILIDGASAPAEIEKGLHDDVVSSLQTELMYNQKDEEYLRLKHSSPEELQVAEGNGGDDLLPENYIDPHPSLDANPEVNPSMLDMPASVADVPLIPEAQSTPGTDPNLPDNLAPQGTDWKPAEIKVFETILNTDNPPADVPSESSPETMLPADAPAN